MGLTAELLTGKTWTKVTTMADLSCIGIRVDEKQSVQYLNVRNMTKNGNHEKMKTPNTMAIVLVAFSCLMDCNLVDFVGRQ